MELESGILMKHGQLEDLPADGSGPATFARARLFDRKPAE
jgi:hypothetical protein